MRPASATDTVETDTHSADLSIGVIEARSAAARSSFDDRRKPTTPSRCELTDAWRASRHPMRSRVGASFPMFGTSRFAGHTLLRCRARAFFSRRTIARPTRETSPSPLDRCAPAAFLDVSRAVESSTARPRPPLSLHPVKGEKRARSGTSSIERFHRSGASSPKTLSMPMRSLTALRQ